jgi:carboxyl-terminal processing protease
MASFAEENNLATIVGVKTAGRFLSGSTFRAGDRYIVGLPVAAYLTWQGSLIEEKGVAPTVPAQISPEALVAREDPQMQRAVEVARET